MNLKVVSFFSSALSDMFSIETNQRRDRGKGEKVFTFIFFLGAVAGPSFLLHYSHTHTLFLLPCISFSINNWLLPYCAPAERLLSSTSAFRFILQQSKRNSPKKGGHLQQPKKKRDTVTMKKLENLPIRLMERWNFFIQLIGTALENYPTTTVCNNRSNFLWLFFYFFSTDRREKKVWAGRE
jgi:hypothetical protein